MTARDSASLNGGNAVRPRAVLVTGAAGFIGSHLCERLLGDGRRVWGLDNFDDFYDPTRKRENLSTALCEPDMHLVEGDVRDDILLDGLMSDVEFDSIVHLAARPGAEASMQNPELCFDVNVRGTLCLLEAMRRHSVPVLLLGSSSSVYGEGPRSSLSGDSPADRPVTPYAASKRSAELLCHSYHHLYGLTAYCLRMFHVYGPRQRPDLTIHRFARLVATGQSVPIPTDGNATDNYIYVDDVIDGIVNALQQAEGSSRTEPAYTLLNLGSNQDTDLYELLDLLADAFDSAAYIERNAAPSAEILRDHTGVAPAQQVLGYPAETRLEDGLAKFARWYNEEISADNPAGRT